MVSTTGGRRPSRPRDCRSGRVKAVPLFNAGISRITCPRRCGESLVDGGEEDVVAKRTSMKNSICFGARQEGALFSGNLKVPKVRLSHSAFAAGEAKKNSFHVMAVTQENRGLKIKIKEVTDVGGGEFSIILCGGFFGGKRPFFWDNR